MLLDIEAERGWMPGTLDSLPHAQQAQLVAHWRVKHLEPPK
jgi:hypothetical protein